MTACGHNRREPRHFCRGFLFATALLAVCGCASLFPAAEEEPEEDDRELRPEAPRYAVSPVGDIARFTGPVDLSSIAWVGGDIYAAASDSDGILAELDIGLDGDTGAITRYRCVRTVRLDGVVDGEGIAYDRSAERVWVSDEAGNTIREFTMDGVPAREVSVPDVYSRCRPNLGLEALTMSPDGFTLWTCNEEAIEGDGERSTRASGSVVRISRFVRSTLASNWRFAGQWAYRTGKVKGTPYRGLSFSGVSGLCALPDGTLLVLEREMSKVAVPRFRSRIFQVDFEGATDVSRFPSLEGVEYERVKKRKIFQEITNLANYEGICLGPELSDGSRVLLLISDGDGPTTECLYSLRLGLESERE